MMRVGCTLEHVFENISPEELGNPLADFSHILVIHKHKFMCTH